MHLQATMPNWTEALLEMPDDIVLKGFDAGILRDGKERWIAAGRDPKRLFTVHRHADVQTAPAGDWESVKAHWRTMFKRYIDGTYLDKFKDFVDYVSESNEYTATSTWQSPAETTVALMSMRGAAHIWNTEYRGKLVPDTCRIALMAGPVSNDIPREVFTLALAEDCPIDYHAYTRWFKGTRSMFDWKDDSGRWDRHEQAYGLKPDWLFGESGPYINAEEGWRHENVLNANIPLLVQAMRVWLQDVAKTAAYKEGRLIGPGCWFTSGHVGWKWYQLETPELKALATMVREEWHPGKKATVNDQDKKAISEHANAILDITQRQFQAKIKPGVTLNIRSGPATSFPDIGDLAPNEVVNVFAVSTNNWYRISRLEDRWMSGDAKYSERVS